MKPKLVIWIALFILSEAVGLAIGQWFFQLFMKAVPPVAQSQFNLQASQIAHLIYGAGVGLVLFLWSLFGMAAGGMMRSMSKPGEKS